MKRVLTIAVLIFAALPRLVLSQQKPEDRVIAEALSALPKPLRDGAGVRAHRDGELVVLRESTNGLICLGDDPAAEGWHVACYQADLEPFMARGRQLRAEGVTERAEIDSVRLAEIESGKLRFPTGPRALYSLFGKEGAFDPTTGEAEGAGGLYVLYVPYATEETIGITTVSSRDRPWLMAPGRPWAHIMIAR